MISKGLLFHSLMRLRTCFYPFPPLVTLNGSLTILSYSRCHKHPIKLRVIQTALQNLPLTIGLWAAPPTSISLTYCLAIFFLSLSPSRKSRPSYHILVVNCGPSNKAKILHLINHTASFHLSFGSNIDPCQFFFTSLFLIFQDKLTTFWETPSCASSPYLV